MHIWGRSRILKELQKKHAWNRPTLNEWFIVIFFIESISKFWISSQLHGKKKSESIYFEITIKKTVERKFWVVCISTFFLLYFHRNSHAMVPWSNILNTEKSFSFKEINVRKFVAGSLRLVWWDPINWKSTDSKKVKTIMLIFPQYYSLHSTWKLKFLLYSHYCSLLLSHI